MKDNEDAISLAHKERKKGIALREINSRLAVLKAEYSEHIRLKTLEEIAERERCKPNCGVMHVVRLKRNGPHELGQMSTNGVHRMEQDEIADTLHYLRF